MEDIDTLAIITALQSYRYNFSDEKEFQDGIERALQAAFIPHERECLLGENGIIDFRCENGVGIEVKIKGSKSDVRRQIARYVQDSRISSVIIATTRHAHLSIHMEINAKPVRSVFLGNPF